jgi:hypothetical protein
MMSAQEQIEQLTDQLNIRNVLLELLLAEISANAPAGPYRGFLSALGRRIAREIQLPGTVDLKSLQDAINRVCSAIGAGSAEVTIQSNGISIEHHLPPGLEANGRTLLPDAFLVVLESAYDSWFRALGSGEHIRTERVSQTRGTVSFWHGV